MLKIEYLPHFRFKIYNIKKSHPLRALKLAPKIFRIFNFDFIEFSMTKLFNIQ